MQLTPRFTQAVDYARQVHVSLRKGTQVPYMAHVLGVASLMLGETGHVPFPVTEDMAIAALLHDAVEDEGGLPRLRDIEAKFVNNVAKIVEGCTDSFEEDANKKLEWEQRKSSYIERLWNEPPETLLSESSPVLAFTRENVGGVQNCTDSRRRVSTICQNEKERTHAQTSILRAVSYLWCRDQEELCAAFRYSALKTSRRPEVCRH